MKLIVFLLSLFSLIGSTLTLGREVKAAYFSRNSEREIFYELAFGTDPIDLPLSSGGKREVLETCAGALQGTMYAFQPNEVRQAMDSRCAAFASRILVLDPTYSAAYTVQMLSSADPEASADPLVMSQLTGPSGSWNAKLRLFKGMSLYGTGKSDVDAALRSDILFLVQTYGGRVWLARLYKKNDTARTVIVETIDKRPTSEKTHFLREVAKLG
jgi:hypothetical protein